MIHRPNEFREAVRSVMCPYCWEPAGMPCRQPNMRAVKQPHRARVESYRMLESRIRKWRKSRDDTKG